MTEPNTYPRTEIRQADRQNLLDQFSERPTDTDLWTTVYGWVRSEDGAPNEGIAGDIPAEELITLANRVRFAPQAERYDLMIQKASNGRPWFDVLTTFSSDQLNEAKSQALETWFNGNKFFAALDLGTGTGKSLRPLEDHAETIVGFDRNSTLLYAAKDIAGKHTSLVLGEVNKLPFDDASFDLISSSGLSGALDRPTATAFIKEVARVMTDDGVYIEASYLPGPDGGQSEELDRISRTSKGTLADMLVDIVSGKLTLDSHLEFDEREALCEELGLRQAAYDFEDNSGRHNFLLVITKQ